MARGRRPKPPVVRVMDGTHRAFPGKSGRAPGRLTKPKGLPKDAARVWDETAPQLRWLGRLDSHTLAIWCSLYAEFLEDPRRMTASRLSQMRAYGAELGITASSRTRMDVSHEAEKAKSRYFKD